MRINEHENTAIADALARLRESTNTADIPHVDPSREAALLNAFDAHQLHGARAHRSFGFSAWAAAAALIVMTVSLNWMIVTRPRVADARRPKHFAATVPTGADVDTNNLEGFVAWPGASAWPPLESGSVMRVDLPVSLLPTLGLPAFSSAAGVVAADIVVGQDGLARAVRLVQQQ